MAMFETISQFLLSEWLWNSTFGWYQQPLNFLLMALILRYVAGMHIISSVMVSFGATITSYLIFSMLVVGGLVGIFHVDYPLTAQPPSMIYAALYLGLIYAGLQIMLCLAIRPWYKMRIPVVVCTVLVSNVLAALLTYWML